MAQPAQPAQPAPPATAADAAKQGMDRYNAGDFEGAIAPLEKAVQLEPTNFQYRFTLAEAYRQSGQCAKARPLYTELSAQTTDTQVKANIDSGLSACPEPAITPPPPSPAPPPPPPEPVVIHSGISRGNILMLATAGVAVGLGVGFIVAAHGDAEDADYAAKYDDHDRIAARSTTFYIAGGVALATGIGLGVLALHRISVSNEHDTTIAVAPRAGGGSLVLEGSW